MIEKINGIRIKGRCFKEEKNLLFFNDNNRISIVYGKNGSGKSTISQGIATISTDDTQSDISTFFIDSNRQDIEFLGKENVFVFNEDYIDKNVRIDEDGLGTIVLLGEQVNLQSEIESKEEKVKTISDDLEKLTAEYSKYNEKNNPLNPEYHMSRIVTTLKKSGGWAEVDSQIKKNKIKSQVNDSIVKEIGELKVNATNDELREKYDELTALLEKVSNSTNSYPNEVEQIKIDADFDSVIVETLARKIEKSVLSEREKLIIDAIESGFQDRVESAREDFSNNDVTICPYCYQPVTEQYKHDLVDNNNKVLNKDVDEHKAQLSDIRFPVLDLDRELLDSLDSTLTKKAIQQLENCNLIIMQYQELILQKEGNVYTPIIIESKGLNNSIEKLNLILGELETKRLELNDAAKKKTSIIKELVSINKSIAHIDITKLYKDYLKQEKDKVALSNSVKEKQDALNEENEELKKLIQKKANVGLAIENINNSLDYVFLTHGRLSIELRDDKYYLKSNGDYVLPKRVSQGERNIIALCYFFTHILSNQEISKLYKSEAFIVIDDPISSFDFENKIGITSFLRFQTDCIIKGNENSKILFLSHDLETVFALRKAIEEICKSTKGIAKKSQTTYSAFELSNLELSLLERKHNEYGSLLKRVYHFANGDMLEDSLVVGNEMRRVLEAFSSFTYRQSIENVSCDANVLSALGNHSIFFENLMYRLALHGESHYEEQIYTIHDGYNFYEFISKDEKIKTAKSILCFMYLLNPFHISAYLQTEPDAINNIKTWVNSIPKNDSFEINENKKRIIPLYDLPISAGVGNESFEGVPFEMFETENMICDFALRVSGDSMEPIIPDGSIVFVKKQETIEDGDVGAFYYSGKVYCKYLIHKDNKILLCSYNDNYDPIVINEDAFFVYGKVVEY